MKLSVLVATFPYGGTEHYPVRNYLIKLALAMKADSRVGEILTMDEDDTPITMSRNKAMKFARDSKIDLVLMIDSDMEPDKYLGRAGARPFWESSFEFMLRHRGPCVVGVPYCGPPPHENVYVFRWASQQSDHPNCDMRLEQYSREEAAIRGGMEEVAALPTGLILIDTRTVEKLTPPWFEYEYEDPPFNTKKASTEDVYFTRNASLAGVPQYVNWDAWAGHIKRKRVGKPTLLTTESVAGAFREALASGRRLDERLIDVGVNA